jgi:hypothetical protein
MIYQNYIIKAQKGYALIITSPRDGSAINQLFFATREEAEQTLFILETL